VSDAGVSVDLFAHVCLWLARKRGSLPIPGEVVEEIRGHLARAEGAYTGAQKAAREDERIPRCQVCDYNQPAKRLPDGRAVCWDCYEDWQREAGRVL
jgi:hypothetical protein